MRVSIQHRLHRWKAWRLQIYKHSTNNAQTSNKYVGRKDVGLNCHGLLGAETAIGRIDQRLLFVANILTVNNCALFTTHIPTDVYANANRMSTPIPIEASRVFSRVFFVFVLPVPGFLSTSTLYYIESQKPCLFMRKRQQVAAFATLTLQTLNFSLQVQTSITNGPKPSQ